MKTLKTAFAAAILATLFFGCAGKYTVMYPGQLRHLKDVAVIREVEGVTIEWIRDYPDKSRKDFEASSNAAVEGIEILPGRHIIVIKAKPAEGPTYFGLTVDLEAGKSYTIYPSTKVPPGYERVNAVCGLANNQGGIFMISGSYIMSPDSDQLISACLTRTIQPVIIRDPQMFNYSDRKKKDSP